MISRKALLVGFVGLVFAVSGTATVLQSFGTISGTADVRPALNITAVGNVSTEDQEYFNFTNQASESISVSRVEVADEASTDQVNNSDRGFISSGEKVVVTEGGVSTSDVDSWFEEDTLHLTADGEIGSGLNDGGDTVYVKIDGKTVDSFSYGGSQ